MLTDVEINDIVKRILNLQDIDLLTLRTALAISAVEEPRVVENYRNTLITHCVEKLNARSDSNVHTVSSGEAAKRQELLNLIAEVHTVFRKIGQDDTLNPVYTSFVEATLDQLSALSPFTEHVTTDAINQTNTNELLYAFTSGLAQLPPLDIIKALHICKDYTQAAEANIVYLRAIAKTGHRSTIHANLLYKTVLESSHPAIQEALASMTEAVRSYERENGPVLDREPK